MRKETLEELRDGLVGSITNRLASNSTKDAIGTKTLSSVLIIAKDGGWSVSFVVVDRGVVQFNGESIDSATRLYHS